MVTTEMLQPIIDAVRSNALVVLPVCIAIFAVILGISIIPKLIKAFTGVRG